MTNPCALFTSCCDSFPAEEFIKRIKNQNELEGGVNDLENIWHYNWHIDTKYYTADIELCHTSERTIGNTEFAELVQAVIIYFNPNQESSFDKAKSWLPYLNELSPPIQILVCETCSNETVVKRNTVQEWCIKNEFELVELSPLKSDDDDEYEDDFEETTGIRRIIQALHAHTWSNLEMKDNPSIQSPYMRKLMEEEKTNNEKPESESEGACGDCKRLNESDDPELNNQTSGKTNDITDNNKKTKTDRIDDLILQDDDMAVFDAVGNDDPGGSFETLFAKFSFMKEKADTLPPEQRKAYAEKVAVSFWKALGGDDDDDGIDSSGDET